MADLEVQANDMVRRLGLQDRPDLLDWAVTPIDRGHHLAFLAAAGSGKETVFGLAALEASEAAGQGAQVLVIVPDGDRESAVARAIQRCVEPSGLAVARLSSEPDASSPPDILVARATTLLPRVRAGAVGLSGLRLLVIDGFADMKALGEWTSAEPVLETVPDGCRKVLVSHRADPEFVEVIRRQLPRARTWPEELLTTATRKEPGEPGETEAGAARTVLCRIATEGERAAAIRGCLADARAAGCAAARLTCVDTGARADLRAALMVSGIDVAPTTGTESVDAGEPLTVALGGTGDEAAVLVGLPLRLEAVRDALPPGTRGYAVVAPALAPQLDLMLARMGARSVPVAGGGPGGAGDDLEEYRATIRATVQSGDWMPDLALVEPLLAELGAAPVAAALSRLYRVKHDGPEGPVRPWPDVEAASTIPEAGARPERRRRRAEEVPLGARPAWTRLYFGIGRGDEARAADLVGAITGEAGIAGGQIGKIQVMGKFSLVDVDSQVADLVLARLDGVTIRGREVPVRLDRDA